VGRPHGLDGSFHVLEPRPLLLRAVSALLLRDRSLAVERLAGTDDRPILRLEGFADRDAADSIRGELLVIPRSAAPPLPADEWWAEDLEGCRVIASGRPVGSVRELRALPSCEVLVVERDGAEELLVPFIADAVRSVDVDAGEIDVDLSFLGE
jgi:16S rRNA processing protein RimM